MPRLLSTLLFLGCTVRLLGAEDAPKAKIEPTPAAAKAVELIAETVRKSVVVITVTGRDGKRLGLGTGFIVAADGLIATNLHVVGEARPITVELADGKRHEVTVVHASDRVMDLALIRIDAKDLPALEIGDSNTLKDGQAVVALGNPQGLNHSVVSGVVSGKREIDGRKMIQLAIPIEPGNSGGPLVDLQGRVHGIITMKSAVTANLGFAVPSNALKPLLKKPNPIPMSRWLTIGALDPQDWLQVFGARWRQRTGRILVEGAGSGFGGRSLCLSQRTIPQLPYEVAVAVKLDDEAGAAGLVFHADGSDKHYGFYPTGGQLRLTRFDGPDVFSWKILDQKKSASYKPGDWNTLRVRVDKDKLLCFVNDQLVIESTDNGLSDGKVGLAKFRETKAEFKQFQVGKRLQAAGVTPDQEARVTKTIAGLAPKGAAKPEVVNALLPDAPASMTVLRDKAKQLEQQASQLKQLALEVHVKRIQAELTKLLQSKEDDIDLLHAALLLAKLDNDELDIEAYRQEVERMAKVLTSQLPKNADEKVKLAALNKFLFAERGFHGSRNDYYNRSNSYLNEVLDDREGLPITLSVLYMELARRIGLKIVGIGLPGHFVVQHLPKEGKPQLIDVYEGGVAMSREEAEAKVLKMSGLKVKEENLTPVNKRAILTRMLHNLLGLARTEEDGKGMLRYLDVILVLAPDAVEERWTRAALRFQNGQRQGSIEDVDWILDHRPEGIDIERVLELRRMLSRPEE